MKLPEPDDVYIAVVMDSTTELCLMEDGSAGVVEQCTTRNSRVSALADKCMSRVRGVQTDSHPSNIAAERSILIRRLLLAWTLIHFLCRIHTGARIHKFVFALVAFFVKGMTRFQLSISLNSEIVKFRQALRAEIKSRNIVIRAGPPPQDAIHYRRFMLRLCSWNRIGASNIPAK